MRYVNQHAVRKLLFSDRCLCGKRATGTRLFCADCFRKLDQNIKHDLWYLETSEDHFLQAFAEALDTLGLVEKFNETGENVEVR